MSFHLPSASRGVVSILNNGASSKRAVSPPASGKPTTNANGKRERSSDGADDGMTSSAGSNDPQRSAEPPSPSSVPTLALPRPFSAGISSNGESISGTGPSSFSSSSGVSSGSTSVDQSPRPSSKGLAPGADEGDKVLSHPGFADSPGHMVEEEEPRLLRGQLTNRDFRPNDKERSDTRHFTTHHVLSHDQFDGSSGNVAGDEASSSASVSSSKAAPTIVHGKKRYPCNHPGCGKTFSTSGHAARHNRIHTGQKPYRCTFPGCKARFSRQDNALAHFRTGHALAKPRSNIDDDAVSESTNTVDGGHSSALSAQYDAQVQAGAELGRKALAEGTAIAVVKDGRVERTVGLPRARRSTASSSAMNGVDERSMRDFSESEFAGPGPGGPTPASEYAQMRSAHSPTMSNSSRHRGLGWQTESSVHPHYHNRAPPGPASAGAGPPPHPWTMPPPPGHYVSGAGSSFGGQNAYGSRSHWGPTASSSSHRYAASEGGAYSADHQGPRREMPGYQPPSTAPWQRRTSSASQGAPPSLLPSTDMVQSYGPSGGAYSSSPSTLYSASGSTTRPSASSERSTAARAGFLPASGTNGGRVYSSVQGASSGVGAYPVYSNASASSSPLMSSAASSRYGSAAKDGAAPIYGYSSGRPTSPALSWHSNGHAETSPGGLLRLPSLPKQTIPYSSDRSTTSGGGRAALLSSPLEGRGSIFGGSRRGSLHSSNGAAHGVDGVTLPPLKLPN